jgi:hypothetical protein
VDRIEGNNYRDVGQTHLQIILQEKRNFIKVLKIRQTSIDQVNRKIDIKELTVKHIDFVTYFICG